MTSLTPWTNLAEHTDLAVEAQEFLFSVLEAQGNPVSLDVMRDSITSP